RTGTFFARLVVTDSNGNSGSSELTIEANNTLPMAACRLSNDAPIPGERVQYDGSGSIDLDGELVDFVWDFGDGETTRGTRVSHVYDEAGIYTVRLTVEDDCGGTASVTHDVNVHRGTSSGGGCGGGAGVGLF
ncbi:PKD domain-containing protein, partial [Candidatus Bipolaricaulota bacterium]|nr:PKD domain-containing protein [Candidatus Bipolaricaulota bacterium]